MNSYQTRIVIDEKVLKEFRTFLKIRGLLMGHYIGQAIVEKMERDYANSDGERPRRGA
jgi:hypothetical protein